MCVCVEKAGGGGGGGMEWGEKIYRYFLIKGNGEKGQTTSAAVAFILLMSSKFPEE